MFKKYFPYARCKSVFDIDYEELYAEGIRALIFDIDATLVPHGDPCTPRVEELFGRTHEIGFKTLILSNNSAQRIEAFIKNIDTKFIELADKPRPGGYIRALEMLGEPKENTLVIGDQLFTDVLGANRCGIRSVLVDFLLKEGETKLGKKRKLELFILKFCNCKDFSVKETKDGKKKLL
ncbi:MAG: YqeG family HAD IIIA-type phosphatase [Ruminococcaceae bacterium]|nr:YqeG family HAD IIIA-type phosphatase [Oscillospiraceae bacterium]